MKEINLAEAKISDVEFIRLLKQKDEDALDQLWESLFLDSVKIARKYKQLDDTGRDAAVRAYSKLVNKGIESFGFRSSFRSYCWTIISREMFRLMKKEFILEELEPERHAAPELEEGNADAQTILKRIQPCIDLLKGNRLKVFTRVDLNRQSPGDVAEALGLSRNNVNKLASRARLDMRQCLEGYGYATVNDVLNS